MANIIRNWKMIRSCAFLLGMGILTAAVSRYNSARAEDLQKLQELTPSSSLSAPVLVQISGLEQKKVHLPMQPGKPYMLHLWATWCVPCREELPQLAAFLKKEPQLPIVPVALESGEPERVRTFLPRLHAETLPIWTAERQDITPFLTSVSEPGLPMTLLIDALGRVRSISDGGVDWAAADAARVVRALLQSVQ